MRKVLSLGLMLIMMVTLVACGEQSQVEYIKVYSYSGENEQYSIVNGVIVLSEDEKENLLDNLYFRISIETLEGEKFVDDIKMKVIDVAEIF